MYVILGIVWTCTRGFRFYNFNKNYIIKHQVYTNFFSFFSLSFILESGEIGPKLFIDRKIPTCPQWDKLRLLLEYSIPRCHGVKYLPF